jgi:hypothetical protein
MAVDYRGPKGQPGFDGTKRSNTAADQTAIGIYAGQVGNRVVCTEAQMAAFNDRFGFDPWDGLECFQSDTGDTFVYNATTHGWDDFFGGGVSNSSGVFTPSSGWAMGDGSQTMTVRHGIVTVYVSFERTGGNLAVPSDGNMANVHVGKLSLPPVQSTGLSSGRSGRLASFVAGSDGYVDLTATTGSQAIETGDSLSFSGTYLA